MQIIMQRKTFGEVWWNQKKQEMADIALAAKQAKQAERERLKAGKDKIAKSKEKEKQRDVAKEINIEMRVRERMGYLRYNFMPWTRGRFYEQIETIDSIEAELAGEEEINEETNKKIADAKKN